MFKNRKNTNSIWKPLPKADFIIPKKAYYLEIKLGGEDSELETKRMILLLQKFLETLNYNYYVDKNDNLHYLYVTKNMEDVENKLNKVKELNALHFSYVYIDCKVKSLIPQS